MGGLAWGLQAFSWLLTSSAFSPYSSLQFEKEFVGVGELTWGCGHIGLESFSSPLTSSASSQYSSITCFFAKFILIFIGRIWLRLSSTLASMLPIRFTSSSGSLLNKSSFALLASLLLLRLLLLRVQYAQATCLTGSSILTARNLGEKCCSSLFYFMFFFQRVTLDYS